MVAYPKILSKIISLLEAGISAYRIEMFIGSADEKLFDRSYEELEAALKTEAISDRYVAVYLQYDFSSHLSEKECSTLNGNLEFLETYCDKKATRFKLFRTNVFERTDFYRGLFRRSDWKKNTSFRI